MLEQIKSKGAYLISLNPDIDFSSNIGEMMFTILLAFHQLERKQIGERVSLNMKNLSKQNILRGKPPFGYKFVSKSEPMIKDEKQQEIINIIKEKHQEKRNYSFISRYLNENKYNICFGNDGKQLFYPQTIKNILSDCGIIENQKRKTIDKRFLEPRKKNII
jgi:DNA invertase Pin-like site-specific DNA recombinase